MFFSIYDSIRYHTMNTKVHIYTSQIEAPLLSSISDVRSIASKSIFDFLLLYHDFQQRAIFHGEAERKTLWKCCSQEIAATLHAFYVKRMKEVFSGLFLQFQADLDAEEPEDSELLSSSRAPHDGKRMVTFGRKILLTAADGRALLMTQSSAGIRTPSREAQERPSPQQERVARAAVRRARMAAFRAEYDAK